MEYSMSSEALLNISPIDGRYQPKTKALANYFSEYALIRYRTIVEIRWFQFLSQQEGISQLPSLNEKTHALLDSWCQDFSSEDAKAVKDIEATTEHDVKAVEYYLAKRFAEIPELAPYQSFLHFACTSEDINNTSYALMLKDALKECLTPQFNLLLTQIKAFANREATTPMISRTHGQPASPTTLGKEFANIARRLEDQLASFSQHIFSAKMNGAVGNYNAHLVAYPHLDWPSLTKAFITQLGLKQTPYTTQIEPHDNLCEFFHAFLRVNHILLDFCKDIWSYISIGYFIQSFDENTVGSSTMPHKVNPINFENAEGNLGIACALFSHFTQKLPISRWQRDLSDSTTLRNIGVAISHSYLSINEIIKGLSKLQVNHPLILADLNANQSLLAEPLQTIMRQYGIEAPYEKLKALTRGKEIQHQDIQAFIHTLDIPETQKQSLLSLSTDNYIGLADKLASQT